MMLKDVVCAVAAGGGWMPSSAAFLFQGGAAVALALMAGWVNRRGLLAMAALEVTMMPVVDGEPVAGRGGGWAGKAVARWEAWGVVAASWVAVLAAWAAAVWVSAGWGVGDSCAGGWRGMVAPLVAGVTAGAGVFVLVDDLRHHGVEVEPVAVCFAGAILWRWFAGGPYGGGLWAAGEAAVVGVLVGSGFWVVNLGLRWCGAAFGNGDWLLIAAAGTWIGTALWGWVAFLAVQGVVTIGMHWAARGRSAPLGPGVVLGVVAALMAT